VRERVHLIAHYEIRKLRLLGSRGAVVQHGGDTEAFCDRVLLPLQHLGRAELVSGDEQVVVQVADQDGAAVAKGQRGQRGQKGGRDTRERRGSTDSRGSRGSRESRERVSLGRDTSAVQGGWDSIICMLSAALFCSQLTS